VYIYPVEPAEGTDFHLPLVASDLPSVRLLFPNQVIPDDDLGRAVVDVAVREEQNAKPGFSRTATSEPWSKS
jgi:hypothetical protein